MARRDGAAGWTGGSRVVRCSASDDADVLRFLTLATGGDVEFDALPLVEGPVAVPLDVRVVHENVVAAFARDEAEALLGIEELHSSSCHRLLFSRLPAVLVTTGSRGYPSIMRLSAVELAITLKPN
jgi:hypothetical protein